jgi:hypothetical protein
VLGVVDAVLVPCSRADAGIETPSTFFAVVVLAAPAPAGERMAPAITAHTPHMPTHARPLGLPLGAIIAPVMLPAADRHWGRPRTPP